MSVYELETRAIFRWVTEVVACAGYPVQADTPNICRDLVRICQPPLDELEFCTIGCLFLAFKFNEREHSVPSADHFLRLFNPELGAPLITPRQLLSLERHLLRQIDYHIPFDHDPVDTLSYYSGVDDFLLVSSWQVKRLLLQELIEYDQYVQRQESLVAGCAHLSRLRLVAILQAVLLDVHVHPKLLCYRALLDEALPLSPPPPCSSVMQRLLRLFTLCVDAFQQQPHCHGVKLLSRVLSLTQRKQVKVVTQDPCQEICYHRSLRSWLRHSHHTDRLQMLDALSHYDCRVQASNPTPAALLSRLRLLLLTRVVEEWRKRRPLQHRVAFEKRYAAALLAAIDSPHWGRLSPKLLPLARELLIICTCHEGFIQKAAAVFWPLHQQHIDYLVSGCY
jgi:hypothetical protein